MAEEKNETNVQNAEEHKAEVAAEQPVAVAASEPAAVIEAGSDVFTQELRSDIPRLVSGDEIKVFYRVIEGGKERIQIYEGTIIALKNSGIAKTITVRKNSFGIAVERIFPVNSKLVQKIEVKKHSRVRRAKLYYLRNLRGKAARLKELR